MILKKLKSKSKSRKGQTQTINRNIVKPPIDDTNKDIMKEGNDYKIPKSSKITSQGIPQNMYIRTGTMSTIKGKLIKTNPINKKTQEKMLFSWDAINDCINEDCPAYEICHYEKTGKCRVQLSYIRGVQGIIFKNYSDTATETQLYKVGMYLNPLYINLCKFKIAELGVRKVIYHNKAGSKVINPIYKEIRETIKTIEAIWKSIGLDPDDKAPFVPGSNPGKGDDWFETEDGVTMQAPSSSISEPNPK